MPQIRVQNFGPIVDSGLIEIKKNTFFIGNQGSGKSTMAKLISLMMWLEKAYNRGDFSALDFVNYERVESFFKYHSIGNYFKQKSRIDYYGDKFNIIIYPSGGLYSILDNQRNQLSVPKIMYVPAERNFLSTLKGANKIERLPENLLEFGEELDIAERKLDGKIVDLKIGGYQYTYDSQKSQSFILGKDHKVDLTEASSGLQSYTPLYIVSDRLSELILNTTEEELLKSFSVERRRRYNEEVTVFLLQSFNSKEEKEELDNKINAIRAKYFSSCFINIVEEPEQNLFPDSQWEVLKSLVGFNNSTKENKLIVTTHSPYVINYLSIAIQAHILKEKILQDSKTNLLIERLEEIIPSEALIDEEDVAIYQVGENGTITSLETFEGIPVDNNYLNEYLREGNVMFDKLLEIEEEL